MACPKAAATHGAASLDLGPLQGNGDAIEEDEGQDDIVEELVGDNGLTQDSEPEEGWEGGPRECQFAPYASQEKGRGPGTLGTRMA